MGNTCGVELWGNFMCVVLKENEDCAKQFDLEFK